MEMAKHLPLEPKKGYKTALEPHERERVAKRLLEDLNEFYSNFSKPCPLRALSAKFSRAFRGDFYDVLDELEADGKLHVVMLENAAKVIYPGQNKKK